MHEQDQLFPPKTQLWHLALKPQSAPVFALLWLRNEPEIDREATYQYMSRSF